MSFRSSVLLLSASALLLGACEERGGSVSNLRSAVAFVRMADLRDTISAARAAVDLKAAGRALNLRAAGILRHAGRTDEARGLYLALARQNPDDAEAPAALAEIAAGAGNWAEADRYAATALQQEAANVPARIVRLMLDYTRALNEGNQTALSAALARIPDLRAARPNDAILRRVVIAELLRQKDLAGVLAEVDLAIRQSPGDRSLYALRLAVHMQAGDMPAVDAELAHITATFPDDPGVTASVVAWYEEHGASGKAEGYLRQRADALRDDPAVLGALLQFLVERRGPEAALDELNRRIAADGPQTFLRAALASLRFDLGQYDGGLRELRAAIAGAGPQEDVVTLKLTLAPMLKAVGDEAEMRAVIEDILAAAPNETEALKLKAEWLITDDRTAEAIVTLRRTLALAPQDTGAMALLSEAHLRDGERDLARQSLALAAWTSDAAPAESLRYARFLHDDGDLLAAETVLIAALRQSHGDTTLLEELGRVYIDMKDWPRAGDVARAIERSATDEARARAVPIRMAVLRARDDTEGLAAYVDAFDNGTHTGHHLQIAALQALLDSGGAAQAVAVAKRLLAAAPADVELRYLAAMARERAGELEAAASSYRAMVTDGSAGPQVWTGLARVLSQMPNRLEEAATVLDRGLRAFPGNLLLLWARAGLHEHMGEFDAAIAIYENLYARDSSSAIAANNLASLLSARHAEDPDSLARARVVVRRLRGRPEAPFRETYGWIAYLSGDYQTARRELEVAAAALTGDPQVHYRLAMTYRALGQIREAREQYEMVTDIVAPTDTREFVLSTRAYLSTTGEAVKVE